jgi:P4 family phage/plasmid primase-like protien
LGQYSNEEREMRQQRLEDRQQEFEWRQQMIEFDAWEAQRRMDDLESRERNRENERELQRLKAGVTQELDPPCWIDGKPAPGLLVFKNRLVDIGTGKLMELTPRLWTHWELDFDYDPQARCSFWEQWLAEVFPEDIESRDCIEEQLGYGMTDDVRFHKAFLWIGRKGREGKGTLAHVLRHLCSPAAYAALSFHDWLKGEYSKEALMGKKVGCFPDVRFKEGHWYGQSYDPGGIDHVSKEEALKISGGDPVTIRRKWKSVGWEGVLPMKLFLLSNKLPVLNDHILASRFIHIAFNVSFRGREDVTIPDKLKRELPGIANRCLAAYRRLCERGRFIQPASGLELAREVARNSYSFGAFMEDRCLIGEGSVRPQDMLGELHEWCHEHGEIDLFRRVPTSVQLSKALSEYIQRENIEGLNTKTFRAHGNDRVWIGICLKAGRLETRAELESRGIVAKLVKPAEPTLIRLRRRI